MLLLLQILQILIPSALYAPTHGNTFEDILFNKTVEVYEDTIISHLESKIESMEWIPLVSRYIPKENASYYKSGDEVYFLDWFYSSVDISPLGALNSREGWYVSGSKMYGLPYAKSDSLVLFGDKQITGADPSTFEALNPHFSKDQKSVFAEGEVIPLADPKTFEVIPEKVGGEENESLDISWSQYGKDKNSVFFLNIKIPEADKDTFIVTSTLTPYAKDAHNLYFENRVIQEVDRETFEFIESVPCHDVCNLLYSKDKNSLYFKGIKVEGGDAETFKGNNDLYPISGEDKYGFIIDERRATESEVEKIKEKQRLWKEKISNLPSSSKEEDTKTLYGNYEVGNSKKLYFYESLLLDNFNPQKKVEGWTMDMGFRDQEYLRYGNQVFYGSELIKGADAETFEPIDDLLSKDKDKVFYQTTELKNVDVPTFKRLRKDLVADKNAIYILHDAFVKRNASPVDGNKGSAVYNEKIKNRYYRIEVPNPFEFRYVLPDREFSESNFVTDGKTAVYENGELRKDEIDAPTFWQLTEAFSLDKKHIYLYGIPYIKLSYP